MSGPGHAVDAAVDAWGDPWRLEEARPTCHGFEVWLGRPVPQSGPMGRAVIVTAELAAYFEAMRVSPGAMTLPIGATAIKRVRRVLGHHRIQDRETWWLDRLEDLHELKTEDFCARHQVSAGAVSQARQAYLGEHRARRANWWREAEMRGLLLSSCPSSWVAQQMGLAAATVRKYRAALAVAGDSGAAPP